jgi:DNA-binding SARP family transcriptional activator
MDFRILGPVEVLDEDRVITLGGPKQRALLALLVLHANEALSSDRLIDELWGEEPPATAAKTLQAHISRLRKALDGRSASRGELVLTREHGYELRVDPERVDCHSFERLILEGRSELVAGRPERAASAFESALALWRGPPLADLDHAQLAQIEIGRLNELRVVAQEELIEARLALGRHAEVVVALEALIAQHPYRERLRAQLMLAMYRSERQADALQAYQDARKKLVDELGIEPGERLRELEQAVLAQDPALALVSPGPDEPEPALAARARAFVGRDAELAELLRGLDDAFAGRGRLFLILGEPGIGKSRLTEELMAHARDRGAAVLVGRCWEAGGAPAYWPWVQSLGAHARATDSAALRVQLGGAAADLVQLLPELREIFPDLPEPPAVEPEGSRFRLFEAVRSFLRSATEVRPLVLVLDDLHAADEPSLLLLRFIARELGDSRLLVLCALRDVDPAIRGPVASARAALIREPWVTQIELSGLEEADVAEYIALSTEAAPAPRLPQAIHAETEGNPFFVSELVNLLDAEGRISEPDAPLRIPPGLRAVIHERVGRLPERCRRLLVPAAVIGREFELELLASLCDEPLDELLDDLEEAMLEGMVGDVPDSPGCLRFAHALIRDALYYELTPARRLQLHRRVGEALEASHSADAGPHLTELAHHFFAAVPAVSAERAVDYALRAGDQAAGQLAYEEAVRLYELGLSLAEGGLPRCELLLQLGDAQARAGNTPASKRAFRDAFELAEQSSSAEHLARAAVGYGGRILWEVSRDDDQLLALLERALDAQSGDDNPLRVKLLARLAGGPLRDASLPPERKAALSKEALEVARRLGDTATLAYAIHGFILGHHSPAHTPRQLELATELIELANEAGDKERVFDGREERLVSLIELGDMGAARRELDSMAQLAGELRQPAQQWIVGAYRAMVALLDGRLVEAEDLVSEARALGESAQAWNAEVSYRLQLHVLRREQGRAEETLDLLGESVDAYPSYPIFRCALASLWAELGESAESRRASDGLSLPINEEWLVSMGWLAEAAAALGDVEQATTLYEQLLPYADRVAISYPEVATGPVAYFLSILAGTMNRPPVARSHLEQAVELTTAMGTMPPGRA